MIQANELRIGSLVYDKENNVREICGIQYPYTHLTSLRSPVLAQSVQFNEIEPIKLTEEILLNCGFKYKDGEYVRGLWKLAPDYPKEEVIGYGLFIKRLDWTRTNENSIKYLHQLQNLYFALTGKELEVKL